MRYCEACREAIEGDEITIGSPKYAIHFRCIQPYSESAEHDHIDHAYATLLDLALHGLEMGWDQRRPSTMLELVEAIGRITPRMVQYCEVMRNSNDWKTARAIDAARRMGE